MSAKSERKAKIKAEKQATYGKQSAWAQFKRIVIRLSKRFGSETFSL